MSYLADYIHYSEGAETPEPYIFWGGLSILGHVLGNKVWITHGDRFHFRPHLYICLVGDAGSGKNTAIGVNKRLMVNEFSDYLLSSNVQSREDIAWQMADESCIKIWKDETGMLRDYRPFYVLNNEFEGFLSQDQNRMIGFLVDVYDEEFFSTGFKKDRIETPKKPQFFRNPHLSMLVGGVPSWFMSSLKMDLFSKGLGRRLIVVMSTRTKIVPDPRRVEGALTAFERVKKHLKLAADFHGEIRRTPDAMKWWNEWYIKQKKNPPTDPILLQFHATEPMQVLKVALNLHMTEYPFKLDMPVEPLQMAVHLIDALKPNILQLTSGIGRNELAGVGQEMMNFITRMGGMISESTLRKQFYRYLRTPEFLDVEENFIKAGDLVVLMDTSGGKFYFDKDGYNRFQEKQKQKKAPTNESTNTGDARERKSE